MFKLLKKINLGVLIAIFLVLATIGYIGITSLMFEMSRDDIQKFVKDFISESASTNQGTFEDILAAQNDLIEKYFAADPAAAGNGMRYARGFINASNLKSNFESMHENMTKNKTAADRSVYRGTIRSCQAYVSSVQVRKLGLHSAAVLVNYSMALQDSGGTIIYSAAGSAQSRIGETERIGEDTIEKPYYCYIYLSKYSGSWKIDRVTPSYRGTQEVFRTDGGREYQISLAGLFSERTDPMFKRTEVLGK